MGILIAIEGIDGSGKGTQATRLVSSLRQLGRSCELLSFPRYRETQFGRKIGDFLNGRFGQLDQVSPFLVSLLFAGDRFESKRQLLQALSQNDFVVCDRYVASNIAHQAAKLDDLERPELIEWVHYIEYSLYELPRPDLTIFLDIPVSFAATLIAAKSKRTYTDRAADLQEADEDYLARVHSVYSTMALTESQWRKIECVNESALKSVDEIASEVWQEISHF